MENRERRFFMYKKIYQAVAKKHNTTPEDVKREMQKSIDDACKDPNCPILRIPHKGDIPTIDEFLNFTEKHFKK